MAESSDLRQMVMAFRVSELQVLLTFAAKNKCGRKQELLVRALQLIQKGPPTPVQIKIRELYRQIQSEKGTSSLRLHTNTNRVDDDRRRYTNPFTNSMSSSLSSSANDRHGAGAYSMYAELRSQSDRTIAPKSSGGSSSLSAKSSDDTGKSILDATISDSGLPPANPDKGSSFEYNKSLSNYSHPSVPHSQFPVLSDVRFKRLPFYDLLGELLKPSTLVPRNTQKYQETTCVFHLTPQQAQDIAMSRDMRPGSKCDYHVQVQLRFCLMETTCEQADNFPPSICVRVNGKIAQLPNPIPTNKPGVEPKRPGRPVNITSLCRISPTQPNQLVISWSAEYGRTFCVAVYLVRKQTSDILLQRLKNKGEKPAEFSRALIKEKLRVDVDSEIATTSLRVSLLCPLGKMRMQMPCRSSTCTHLQCFDASTFLMMNEKKPTWICPVCDKEAVFDKLMLDGLFIEIYKQTDLTDIEFLADGSWKPLSEKHETLVVGGNTPAASSSKTKSRVDKEPSKASSTKATPEFIDLTLSSSDEDDDDDDDDDDNEPPAKRQSRDEKPPIKRQSRDEGPPAKRQNRGSVSPDGPAIIEVDTPPRQSPEQVQIQDSPVCLSSTANSDTSPHGQTSHLLESDDSDSSNTIITNQSASSTPELKSPIHSPQHRSPVKSPLTPPPPFSLGSGGGGSGSNGGGGGLHNLDSNSLRSSESSSSMRQGDPIRCVEPLRFITAPAYSRNYPYPFPSDFTSLPQPHQVPRPEPPMAHRPLSSQALPLGDSDFNFNVDELYHFGLPGLTDMGHQGDF